MAVAAGFTRTILYYPYMRIEDGPWLRNALLYWDKVASIVPDSLDDPDGSPLTPEIERLRDDGIFAPIHPGSVLKRTDSRIREALIQKIERTVASPAFESARHEPATFAIHVEKFEFELQQWLEQSGLAERHDQSDWLKVGPTVGLLYMSLLAQTFCFVHETLMTPGTDEPRYEDLLLPRVTQGQRHACLDVAFQRVLPVPAETVPLDDIIRFRSTNRDALLRFRSELDRISASLGACTSPADVRDVLTTESETMELGMRDLRDRLKRSKMSGRLASLKTLVGAVVGAGLVAIIGQPLAAAGAAISVGSSVRDTGEALHEIEVGSALSYLHHAREEGILVSGGQRST
jgi:Family of unknown function (DUF6236)